MRRAQEQYNRVRRLRNQQDGIEKRMNREIMSRVEVVAIRLLPDLAILKETRGIPTPRVDKLIEALEAFLTEDQVKAIDKAERGMVDEYSGTYLGPAWNPAPIFRLGVFRVLDNKE